MRSAAANDDAVPLGACSERGDMPACERPRIAMLRADRGGESSPGALLDARPRPDRRAETGGESSSSTSAIVDSFDFLVASKAGFRDATVLVRASFGVRWLLAGLCLNLEKSKRGMLINFTETQK